MEPAFSNREPEIDPEVAAFARVLRSAWEGVPEDKRAAVADLLADVFVPVKTPKKGGPVLENVIELFRREKRQEWNAADVVSALADKGVTTEPKKVYSALTYLSGMKILRRVGYGRYMVEGGGMVITNDREGP
jgi:hypothetical protein